MASYFDEMAFTPLEDGQAPDLFLHLARLMRDYNMFDEMGVKDKLPPKASEKAVRELAKEINNAAGIQCPVCLKEYETNTEVTKMPCNHKFHTDCIMPWLSKTNSCPVCRYELPTDDEDYELYKKEKIRAKQREKDIEELHNSMFS